MSGGVWGRLFRLAVLVLGASSLRAADYVPWREAEVPEPLRECRATWVATVYNLDWPSKPGLPTEVQQEELRGILDGVAKLNLNTVVLQVRTMCDAFFDSPLEPWSYYLTDKVGRAPDPWYDPLAFAIEECHARGLELHA
ncbi:MAG: family 10 glycosylhydrolase, partial [Verrucomicrobiales bacterium]